MNPYFLSFCVPAKLGIAKDLNEADCIGRKAVADFIDSLLLKTCLSQPHKMLKANKVLRLARSRRNCPVYKIHQPDESLKERLWSA